MVLALVWAWGGGGEDDVGVVGDEEDGNLDLGHEDGNLDHSYCEYYDVELEHPTANDGGYYRKNGDFRWKFVLGWSCPTANWGEDCRCSPKVSFLEWPCSWSIEALAAAAAAAAALEMAVVVMPSWECSKSSNLWVEDDP